MKNLILLILILTFISTLTQAQKPCDLTQRFEYPIVHSLNSQMVPDPCDALDDYSTVKRLTVSATATYLEVKKMVKVVNETTYDPETCAAESREISRDTIIVSSKSVNVADNRPTGGYWTIRMELMVFAPQSRPDECLATKLPQGERLEDYWVTHYGKFANVQEAKLACKEFKELHPEFCRAYAYYLPEGCRFQYKYFSILN